MLLSLTSPSTGFVLSSQVFIARKETEETHPCYYFLLPLFTVNPNTPAVRNQCTHSLLRCCSSAPYSVFTSPLSEHLPTACPFILGFISPGLGRRILLICLSFYPSYEPGSSLRSSGGSLLAVQGENQRKKKNLPEECRVSSLFFTF